MPENSGIQTLAIAGGPAPTVPAKAGRGPQPAHLQSGSFSATLQKQTVAATPPNGEEATVGKPAPDMPAPGSGQSLPGSGKSSPPVLPTDAGVAMANDTAMVAEASAGTDGASPLTEAESANAAQAAPAMALPVAAAPLLRLSELVAATSTRANSPSAADLTRLSLPTGRPPEPLLVGERHLLFTSESMPTALGAVSALSGEATAQTGRHEPVVGVAPANPTLWDDAIPTKQAPLVAGDGPLAGAISARSAPVANLAELLQSLPTGAQNDQTTDVSSTRNTVPDFVALLSLTATGGHASEQTHGTSLLQCSLRVPFGQPGWDQTLSEQVTWMLGRNINAAEIRLNPPQLGPIEIRVAMANDQASVTFVSQHGFVREALEAAMPRLREMLEAAGLNLAEANVSDQTMAEQRYAANDQSGHAWQRSQSASAPDVGGDDASNLTAMVTRAPLTVGAIDLFA